MHPVIYLTGAPASGKSTLSRNLKVRYPELVVFAYSEELRKAVAMRGGENLAEDDIRRLSGSVITTEDVRRLDQALIARVATERLERPFLIDSHPVTKEAFGFRITSFSIDDLKALNPDVLICLYTPADVTVARITADPMGRPKVSSTEAEMHTQLQTSVAAQYGVLLGKPVYLVDSSVSEDALVMTVSAKARLQ